MEIFEKVDGFAADNGISRLIRQAGCVVCAYSGGADSSVLLRWLSDFSKKNGVRLVAAHMNHMIRGAESDRDEEFCRGVCAALGVEAEVCRADIPAEAKASGTGLEECARRLRYEFLLKVSKKYGGAPVATAHNATDNLETVIFNLSRGTGARGLCGISPVRDGIFVRPLLSVTSEEIRGFADKNRIEYVYDSTNSDTDYTRNYIRGTIVPALRRLNPSADSAVLRMNGILRDDCDFILNEAKKLSGGKIIPTDAAKNAHPAVLSRAIALLYSDFTGSATDLGSINISDGVDMIKSGRTGSISLPRTAALYVHKDAVFVDRDVRVSRPQPEEILLAPGKTEHFGDFFVFFCVNEADIPLSDENIYNLSIHITADFDKIYGNLFVRPRAPGDTIIQGGMHKKLKKLMCDSNVPQRIRDTLPLFCDSEGILWVPDLAIPGSGLRDGMRPSDKTVRTAHLYVFGNI